MWFAVFIVQDAVLFQGACACRHARCYRIRLRDAMWRPGYEIDLQSTDIRTWPDSSTHVWKSIRKSWVRNCAFFCSLYRTACEFVKHIDCDMVMLSSSCGLDWHIVMYHNEMSTHAPTTRLARTPENGSIEKSLCHHHLVTSTDTSVCYHHATRVKICVPTKIPHTIIVWFRQTHRHANMMLSSSCDLDVHIIMLSSSCYSCAFEWLTSRYLERLTRTPPFTRLARTSFNPTDDNPHATI